MTPSPASAGDGPSRAGPPGRRTNVALLALLLGAFASGVLAYWTGTTGAAGLVTIAHGSAGLGLLLLVPWKSVIVRRGLRRQRGGRSGKGAGKGAGVALGVSLLISVVAGVVHATAGYHPVLGFTALSVHVAAAVVAALLLVAHARGRRQRPRRVDLSRRTVLRAGALGAGALAVYGSVEGATGLLGLPGRLRRATGSYEVGSGAPGQMPVTQWFTDAVPAVKTVQRGSWPLTIGSEVMTVNALGDPVDSVRAVLDCTGGWYAEQEWRGVRLDRLVGGTTAKVAEPAGPPRSVEVVSVTGYRRLFPLSDRDRLLLATHVAGEPLSDGHGGPVRLVAPGRRGFWWVKWVASVELTSKPPWLQPPFPLQ